MMYELLILLIVAVFFLFGRGLFAGDARVSAPWPQGPSRTFLHPMSIVALASKSADYVTQQFKLPWAVRVKRAFLTAEDISITNALTINLEDDESTPNVIISDLAPTAITAGAGNWEELTVDIPNTIIKAGANLVLSYGSGVGDVIVNGTLWLELEPVYG
jgi:hypothetical protein